MDTLQSSTRFDGIASNYASSEVHASSPTLRRLRELMPAGEGLAICDVACGAGHTALSLAGHAARIVGVDPAPKMLDTFRTLAGERGTRVETVNASAEDIPLPESEFDVVVSRLAPHHFTDVRAGIREMARLVKPEGLVVVIDLEGAADPVHDELNHQLEVLHDPTHVRSYTAREWSELFTGLKIVVLETQLSERPQGVPVRRWCEIASSGSDAERAIRELLTGAGEEALNALGIRVDGDEFLMPVRTLLITGQKPR
jgi:ubiquinone/menaquinone biosynthesis C-methylase UbiE